MLAVDSAGAGCSFGSGSFCCDPPAADLAPRGEPTSNDPQVQAFATFAGNYFKSGICSINDAEIPTRKTKRQSIPATSNPSSEQVCRYLVTLFVLYQSYRSATSPAEPFAVAWDQQRQLSNIGYPSFEALAYQVINYSPVEETQIDYCGDLICLGTDATSMLAENNDTMAALCVPCAEEQNFMKRELKPDGRDDNDLSQYLVTSMSRPGSNDEAFSKRYVDPDSWILPGSPGQGPTMIDLMNAVNNNQLRPEYFRWFRFQGSPGGIFGGNPIPNQVELEAVFLLGPNPGQLMQNLMSDTTVGAQNFVTFHIHFHPSGLAAGNHLAITQINVRHASRIQSRLGANPEPGYYAMISENSGRPIFQCAIDPCVGMNPASDTAPSDDTQGQQILRFVQIIRGWGNNARKNKIKKRTNLFFMQPPDPSAIVQVHQQAASNSNGLRYLWSGFAGDNPTANSGEDPTFASWVESRYSVGWAFDMNGNLYTPGPDLINPPTVTTGNPQNVFVHY